MNQLPHPSDTASILAGKISARPRLAVVLGSGLGNVVDSLSSPIVVPMRELPSFPSVCVSGHAGDVVFGKFGDTEVLLLAGRAHYYEGHSMEQITWPMRALAELGVKAVLLTNAAGAINRGFAAGEFMAIEDHINFLGCNPLAGPSSDTRSRFIDLSAVYDPELRRLLVENANRVKVHTGVYIAVSGPTYETPAEIRAFRALGADAVGMSTVPEAIVARHSGMRVAGLSCLTNMAAGVSPQQLSHAEVLAQGAASSAAASELISKFIQAAAKVV